MPTLEPSRSFRMGPWARARSAKWECSSGSRNGRYPSSGRPRGPGGGGGAPPRFLMNIHAYQEMTRLIKAKVRLTRANSSLLLVLSHHHDHASDNMAICFSRKGEMGVMLYERPKRWKIKGFRIWFSVLRLPLPNLQWGLMKMTQLQDKVWHYITSCMECGNGIFRWLHRICPTQI